MPLIISHKRLLELVYYDPESGIFIRRLKTSNFQKVGEVLGDKPRKDGYRRFSIDGKKYYSHVLAWFYTTGEWPLDSLDHIDGDRGNNRFLNLRQATHQQNMYNKKTYKSNTSGYKGVNKADKYGRYRASITADKKKIHLGMFTTAEEAARVYSEAAEKYHKEFKPNEEK